MPSSSTRWSTPASSTAFSTRCSLRRRHSQRQRRVHRVHHPTHRWPARPLGNGAGARDAPSVIATCDDFLGHVTSYQLHLTQIIDIGPGGEAQPIHRDQWAFDFFPFPTGYDVQCNTIWAGDDFTEENGATRIVIGSNQLEDGLRFTLEDSIPAEMTKGSVLFYSGSVYHGGGANDSDANRRAINITYNVSFLRQEEISTCRCHASRRPRSPSRSSG